MSKAVQPIGFIVSGSNEARAVDPLHPLPVSTTAAAGTYTDGSGAFTAGGTSQVVFAANATRAYLFICNTSDTVMYVNFGTAAVAGQPSITLIANGGFYEPLVPPNQSVNLLCATTGKTFVAKQA